MLKLLFSALASLRICSNTLASILIDVDAFNSILSTSITFYLFVFTANIDKFPNTHLPAVKIFQLLLLLIFWGVFYATLELYSRKGKRFLGAVFCITKNQLYHKNTSCPFSNLRPMLVLQVHRSDNLLELQNLLLFFDGLHLHFWKVLLSTSV